MLTLKSFAPRRTWLRFSLGTFLLAVAVIAYGCKWVLDANFSILRRTALSLLKNNHTSKVGIKNKRLSVGWDDDYLIQVLFGE
jgi:hypothetical protein